jgi:nucleotide-binding universal stress UspA family protein
MLRLEERADMFERILLAIDESSHSSEAISAAQAVARIGGGEVRVLHVTDVEVFGRGGVTVSDEDDEASKLVNRVVDQISASGIHVTGVVRNALAGRVDAAIVDEVVESNATMIVMGSRGLTSFEGVLLGSTTQKVLRLAEVPVLIVH